MLNGRIIRTISYIKDFSQIYKGESKVLQYFGNNSKPPDAFCKVEKVANNIGLRDADLISHFITQRYCWKG